MYVGKPDNLKMSMSCLKVGGIKLSCLKLVISGQQLICLFLCVLVLVGVFSFVCAR